MAIVPTLDLRTAAANETVAHVPANIEAEHALLGAVLYDNSAFERVTDALLPTHFYEPFHQRLWATLTNHIRVGKLAEPVLIDSQFRTDKGYEDLGGMRYLADLVDRAPPAVNAPDYANHVLDMALRREVAAICQNASHAALTGESGQSGREIIEEAEAAFFALGESKQTSGFATFYDSLASALESIAAAYERDGSLSGISTGLIDLDQKTGGMHGSDLIILAGRPSMGKTALATNIAFNVAKHYKYEVQPDGEKKTVAGGRVGFFSLEMSKDQLATRILAEVSGVPSDKLRKGDIQAHEYGHIRDAAELIQSIPLYIDDSGGLTIAKLAARARRLMRTVGLDLVVVDYLQLLAGSNARSGANRVEVLTEITVGLKGLAKELGVPVVALSQLSRQVENREDKRPQLSDLRESGSIEQDADQVFFVYREEYYLSRMEPKAGTSEYLAWQEKMDVARGQADLIIGKQRHGPIGTIRLAFNDKLTKFGNLAREGPAFNQQRILQQAASE